MSDEEKVPQQEQDESSKNSKNPDFLWNLPEEKEEEQ